MCLILCPRTVVLGSVEWSVSNFSTKLPRELLRTVSTLRITRTLNACSNNKGKHNFEDYAVEKGRGLEDVHPEKRQKCYVNREEALQGFVSKLETKYRGRKTASHNFLIFESMMRGPHALAAGKHPSYKDYKWYQDDYPSIYQS